jgi:hypothetical protein
MSLLLTLAALFVVAMVAHSLWVLAYGHSAQYLVDNRLETFAKRD